MAGKTWYKIQKISLYLYNTQRLLGTDPEEGSNDDLDIPPLLQAVTLNWY